MTSNLSYPWPSPPRPAGAAERILALSDATTTLHRTARHAAALPAQARGGRRARGLTAPSPPARALTARALPRRTTPAQGLFHPARKVRETYWRLYNNTYIGAQDALVAHYPRLEDGGSNTYARHELDLLI